MKKSLFFLLFLLPFFVPSLCQEVVVFVDDRSMTVTSHKERDGFVYLQLPEGEIAVPKKQIKEIRKETGSTSTVSQAVSQKLFSPESDLKSSLPDKRRAINPLKNVINKRQIEQKPSSEDDEDIDEADGGDEDLDEPEPPPETTDNRPKPIMPMRIPSAPDASEGGPRLSPVIRKR